MIPIAAVVARVQAPRITSWPAAQRPRIIVALAGPDLVRAPVVTSIVRLSAIAGSSITGAEAFVVARIMITRVEGEHVALH